MKLKYLLIPVLIITIIAIFYISRASSQKKEPENTPDVLGAPIIQTNGVNLPFNGRVYRAQWFLVTNADQINLGNNLVDKIPASEIYLTQKCQFLINAGFYTKDNKPIGLFQSENLTLRNQIVSPTFNGFFTVNSMATPRITSALPKDNLRIALQSGPILIENSYPKNLIINADKPARRSVVATTGANTVAFIIIYDPESQFNGPLLAGLPDVLKVFQSETNINLADALNLDGGTASAFYSPEANVSEISPIGSYFCIR